MGLPVKPLTTSTPKARAARAVFLISSAARWRTPSGFPSPQMRAGRMPLWRSSMRASETACPTMVAYGVAVQVMAFKDIPATLDVCVVLERFVYFKVISPTSQLQTVEAPG